MSSSLLQQQHTPPRPEAVASFHAAPAAFMSPSSRVLVLFTAVHFAIILAMVEVTRLGITANGAPHQKPVRAVLLAAFVGNMLVLARNWSQVRHEPPSPLVPRRIRVHLLLLRASRATVFMALCFSFVLVAYVLTQRYLMPDPHLPLPTLVAAVLCPIILGLKLRWLTVWQRRLIRKATDAEIAF